ncbi:hypothetical protein [Micromonospora coerulea]
MTSIPPPQPPIFGVQRLSDALAALGAYAEPPTGQDLAAEGAVV